MTCDQALEQMLDAELTLLASGGSELAGHVRGCVRCGRIARRLQADTQQLAVAMSRSDVRRARRVPLLVWATPVAAAAALLVMLSPPEPVERVAEVASVLSPVTVDSFPPAPAVAPIAAKAAKRGPMLRAFPVAQSITPVSLPLQAPIATPARVVASNAVSVTPPAGTRAVVMQTSDPKLVVVWLYDPEEPR